MNSVTAHLLEISYQGVIACEWVGALMDHDMCMKGGYGDTHKFASFVVHGCDLPTDVFIGH